MKTFRIEVTQQDIEQGNRKACRSCPVALAIQRSLKPGVRVQVGVWSGDFKFENEERYTTFKLDHPFPEFIKRFDDYGSVEPFVGEIKVSNRVASRYFAEAAE